MKHTFSKSIACALLLTGIISIVACGGRPVLNNLPARTLYERGMEKYQKEDYIRSIEYFQAIVYNFPGESLVDTAQFYLGLSYFGQKDYKLASVEFNRLLQNYPSSVYATNAQFMKAVCLFEAAPDHYGLDQTDLKDALQQLEDFVIDHPESELIPEVQAYIDEGRNRLAKKTYEAGLVYQRIRALAAAKTYYQAVVDDYTDTKFGPLAAFGIAEADLAMKNYGEARTRFENFMTAFPEHELAGKAREKAAEAAYKDAEKSIEAGETTEARLKLESYLAAYPNGNKAEDARDKLQALPPVADSSAQASDGQS